MLDGLRLWLREDTWVRDGLRLLIFKLKELAYKLRYRLSSRRRIKAYLAGTDRSKLNLGAGALVLDGFLNTDVFGQVPVNIANRMPFGNEKFDLIYSCHVVEHIRLEEFKRFLRESYRILKHGGKNVIATPSLGKVARILYGDEERLISVFRERYLDADKEPGFFASRYINNLTHLRWGHKFLYDFEFIHYLGREAGYSRVESIDNFAVPDGTVVDHLRRSKADSWDLETETFELTK